jgi:predicted DNA-binding transcriptional regulator AlpA
MTLKLTRAQLSLRYNRDERTIDRWIRDPKMNFPEPMRIGRSALWDESEIEEWERSLPRVRSLPKLEKKPERSEHAA